MNLLALLPARIRERPRPTHLCRKCDTNPVGPDELVCFPCAWGEVFQQAHWAALDRQGRRP